MFASSLSVKLVRGGGGIVRLDFNTVQSRRNYLGWGWEVLADRWELASEYL